MIVKQRFLETAEAIHKARWIAEVIYAIKLQHLKSRVKLIRRETLTLQKHIIYNQNEQQTEKIFHVSYLCICILVI